ncbi:pyruvate kinase [Phycisphaerales bacterium AB-hyl4]|uniref:Pyruvate kinase n=1 Tax=Natronomicrosphaera hydrolytica TaxID=3242702 RepID=A0ABV4U9S2_9BACT
MPASFVLTKIIATVGPACADVTSLARLIEEGAHVFRINFSHGSFDDFHKALTNIREASRQTETPIGILGDLSGPKIRVKPVRENVIHLVTGDCLEFVDHGDETYRDENTDHIIVPTTYSPLVNEVHPGHRVLIDDGAIRTLATERITVDGKPRLVCRVIQPGPLSSKKGVNLPDSDISAPSLTEWDDQCVDWAIAHGVDYLALSFVRKADDIKLLKDQLRSKGRDNRALRSHTRLPIIAKIETPQAVRELNGILEECDGVMVARGDLGVEMDLAEVPVVQKRIISEAHHHGKPVIVATQMLQSMIEAAAPTRAEVSDAANAILDGADALMLSGETAVGKHGDQAVAVLRKVAAVTEQYDAPNHRAAAARPPKLSQASRYRTAALAHGVSVIVKDLDARFVVTWSELGGGARYLSQNRMTVPIIAVSSNEVALRQMCLMFGVTPVWMPRPEDSNVFVRQIDELLLNNKWSEQGQPVVIAKGEPIGTPGVTNKIRIHYVGDVCRLTWHAKEGE